MIKTLYTNLIRALSDENEKDLKRSINSKTLLGRLPSWVSTFEQDNDKLAPLNVRKVNRYLSYQETRLKKLKENKQYHELVLR